MVDFDIYFASKEVECGLTYLRKGVFDAPFDDVDALLH